MISKTMAGGLVGLSFLALLLISGGASAAPEESGQKPNPPFPPNPPPNPGPLPPFPLPFPPPSPTQPTQGGCPLDANMPPDVAVAVKGMLGSATVTAAQLEQAAASCQQNGYPSAAACLRQAAAAKAGGGVVEPPKAQPCPLDATMGPELAAATSAMLRSPLTTGAQLEQAAALAVASGYPLAAACLRAEAGRRGAAQVPTIPTIPNIPTAPVPKVFAMTIREGDIPFVWAKHFTGDPNRWRELGTANPELLPLQTKNSPVTGAPTTNYAGWLVGKKVRLPAGWDAARGTPPLAGAPARPVPPTGGI